jgi:hypothetical protein
MVRDSMVARFKMWCIKWTGWILFSLHALWRWRDSCTTEQDSEKKFRHRPQVPRDLIFIYYLILYSLLTALLERAVQPDSSYGWAGCQCALFRGQNWTANISFFQFPVPRPTYCPRHVQHQSPRWPWVSCWVGQPIYEWHKLCVFPHCTYGI